MADSHRAHRASRRAAVAALLVLAAVLAGGCSTYRYYTQTTLQEYDLPPESVKRIQFYLDAPLTLRFEKRVADTRVDEHGIDARPYRLARTIEVVENAGGEAIAAGETWIKVRVARDLVLEFRPSSTSSYGMYYLAAINDQVVEDRGTIYYRDNYYEVIYGTVDGDGVITAGPHPRVRYRVRDVERTHREHEEIGGIYLEDRERERREQRDAGRAMEPGAE